MKQIIIALLACYSSHLFACDSMGQAAGSIATNSHILEIWSVKGDIKYVVKDVDGTSLTEQISQEQLALTYPALSKLMREGIADDASVGPELPRPAATVTE